MRTPPSDIYTLSLHDALPIYKNRALKWVHLFSEDMESQLPFLGLLSWNLRHLKVVVLENETGTRSGEKRRSEEHTSELQSLRHLVCRLLLEKKKKHNHGSVSQ